MQQYIRTRCDEIDTKYYQQERALQDEKNKDCLEFEKEKNKHLESTEKTKLVISFFAIIVTGFLGAIVTDSSGPSFFVSLILCVVAYFAVSLLFRSTENKIRADAQQKIDQREKQLQSSIQTVNAKKKADKKKLEAEINNKMNQYRKTYEQSNASTYLAEWILNVLSIEINKADRSKWLPQVKAKLRFNVNDSNIEVPSFGIYDMAAQGIHIDNNPMSLGALAYVLEQMTVAEARNRFQIDANGGRTVITSTRNDTHVEITYNAPNGGVNTMQ